ncbi:DUF3253 domain-containing protein [Sphingomonas prati]|uniref:DUF3253 domain-containing protein n=1 Tax=Sphingomonas prati TaxID=1843237 RepID=A0A7W9BRB1_9SPHN|nr:DUF3253 domain-containing protein [Sphingomonas prati]MBB5728707.1 hypothetical protein [Sphingomonas prati]GGE71732.1 hypothetical protein GCM10011404_00230 [Sphingomonas prati]
MDVRGATLKLLAARAPGATICPSEVARNLAKTVAPDAAGDWREFMPVVHAAVDALVDAGTVRLSWKGRQMAVRAGPYRIARND